jgi:CIC family chloride channel protein
LLGAIYAYRKAIYFLSSVLVGISSAFAVIVLKSFAHQVFSFATYINGILKLSFINSLLPIAGLVLTVFVVKRVLWLHRQRNSQILYSVAKSQYSSKTNVCPNNYKFLTVGLGGSAGLESPIVVAGAALDQIMRSATN